MHILVSGGLGYIGSHTIIQLIEAGYTPIILDNLINSRVGILDKITRIVGDTLKSYPERTPIYHECDCCDIVSLELVIKQYTINSIIHFAALKSVSESISLPIRYYRNNLLSTLNLLSLTKKYSITNFIFSSSCTVYSNPPKSPIRESAPSGESLTNVYAKTKYMCETMIRDVVVANPNINYIILRYFNPIGNHSSGILGDDPSGIPGNLVPYIQRVMSGRLPILNVYGDDYNTPDGTAMRDFIHVVDLADAHIKSIEFCRKNSPVRMALNIGTGNAYSVLDIVTALSSASGKKIPYIVRSRRAGDLETIYCDPSMANATLGWYPKHTLSDMCSDICKFVDNTSV